MEFYLLKYVTLVGMQLKASSIVKAINETHKTAELKNKFSKPFHTVKFEFNICKTISLREKFGVGNATRFI